MKRALLPLGILLLGLSILVLLVKTRPQAEKRPSDERGALVDVVSVEKAPHRIHVAAFGTVIPARSVELQFEVTGRVVWQSPQWVPGGRFKSGDAMVAIDKRDYELAVEQQYAMVDRAKLELELEQGRKVVAAKEWKFLSENAQLLPEGSGAQDLDDVAGSGQALALREPQLRTAKVELDAAESGLKRTQLNLSKTTLRAPFNGFVQAESIDIGAIISPQTRLGTLVGTDAFWVQISVPMQQLNTIVLPTGGEAGAATRVWYQAGDQRIERQGRVIRLLGDVDPVGKMARLLVEVDDPFGLNGKDDREALDTLPLLLGTYVAVEIEGHALESAVRIPRMALREGDKVYVYAPDGTLDIRDVSIRWRESEYVHLDGGLSPDDLLIISRLNAAGAGYEASHFTENRSSRRGP
ncbi:MAG: HlyD family efflux transporter periplasmic adaptor subunit [Myxococcota bacterium]